VVPTAVSLSFSFSFSFSFFLSFSLAPTPTHPHTHTHTIITLHRTVCCCTDFINTPSRVTTVCGRHGGCLCGTRVTSRSKDLPSPPYSKTGGQRWSWMMCRYCTSRCKARCAGTVLYAMRAPLR
jgi:hypothetical protein